MGPGGGMMPEYKMPYRVVLHGTLVIEADSEHEAREIADNGMIPGDSDFYRTAELVDWEVQGRIKEVKV